MRLEIVVEIMKNNKQITAKDLKVFGAISFIKGLPKAIRRAIKASCWPFDANVQVHILDVPKENKGQ